MMLRRAALVVWLSVIAAVQAVPAQETTPAGDPNVRVLGGASSVLAARQAFEAVARHTFDQVMTSSAADDPNLCAVVVLPGPAGSFTIRFGAFNVAADRLDVLILDSFLALGGQSLLHQTVLDTAPPASGTVTVDYPPDDAGKGPVVVSFTNFTQFQSAAFSTDPDSYADPDFGATVQDLDQTVIELVYSGDQPGSRRCQGTLTFDATLNASVANVIQIFP
jgi:hypothetical protein